MIRTLTTLLLLTLLSVLPDSLCASHTFTTTNHYRISSSNTVSAETWVNASGSIDVQGTMKDDFIFLVPWQTAPTGPADNQTNTLGSCLLEGVFENDIWGIANAIELNGRFEDHVRVFSFSSISANGIFEGNFSAMASWPLSPDATLSIGTGTVVRGDAYLEAVDVSVNGLMIGTTRVKATSVVLGGTFEGDVHVTANTIQIPKGTTIGGRLYHQPGATLIINDPDAITGGISESSIDSAASENVLSGLTLRITFCMSFFVIGILFCGITPELASQAVHRVRTSMFTCMLIGVGTVIFLILSVIIFATVGTTGIVFPLTVFLASCLGMSTLLAQVVIILVIGTLFASRIDTQKPSSALMLMLSGLFVYFVVIYLPASILSPLLFSITFIGTGAIILALLDKRAQHIHSLIQSSEQAGNQTNTQA